MLKVNGAFKSHNRSTQYSSVLLAMTNPDTLLDLVHVRTRDKWVPVITAWRVLRLRMEERPLICRVPASILNKQSRTADKGMPSRLGLGEVLTNPHGRNWHFYERVTCATGLD